MLCFEFHAQMPYLDALNLQREAAEQARHGAQGKILGMEHPPVITLGKRGRQEADVLAEESQLRSLGINLIRSERGGQATLHAPGQLIIYPILPLRQLGWGAKFYVNFITEVSERFLTRLKVQCHRSCQEPGLFSAQGKLIFFGVQISNGVSQHGLAINVTNDLGHFSLIRSCGVQAQPMDSLAKHDAHLPLDELFAIWCDEFRRMFESHSKLGVDLNQTY